MSVRGYNLEGDIKAKLAKLDAADDHPIVAIAERAVFATQAFLERLMEIRQLHRRRFFPDLGNFNIALAAEFRAEAREIRSHWR